MKIKDIRKKSDKDLLKEEDRLRRALAVAEKDRITTDNKNVKKQKNLRRDLARVLTVLNENEIDETDEITTQTEVKKEATT